MARNATNELLQKAKKSMLVSISEMNWFQKNNNFLFLKFVNMISN